jgi:hypothetical protein
MTTNRTVTTMAASVTSARRLDSSGDPAQVSPKAMTTIDVQLRPEWIAGVGYRYDVTLADEVIVRRSRDPGHDAARVLHSRGRAGSFRTIDFLTGKPRMIYDIAKAAKVSVIDRSDGGLVVVPYRPMSEEDKARARLHRTDRGRRSAGGMAEGTPSPAERPGDATGVAPRALPVGEASRSELEAA